MADQSLANTDIIYSGWLYKKGRINASFKKRYFCICKDRTIWYYTKKAHSLSRSKANGKINLTQIKRVEFVQFNDPKNNNIKSSSLSSLMSSSLSSLKFRTKPSNISTVKHVQNIKRIQNGQNKVNGWSFATDPIDISAITSNSEPFMVVSSSTPPDYNYNFNQTMDDEKKFEQQRIKLDKWMNKKLQFIGKHRNDAVHSVKIKKASTPKLCNRKNKNKNKKKFHLHVPVLYRSHSSRSKSRKSSTISVSSHDTSISRYTANSINRDILMLPPALSTQLQVDDNKFDVFEYILSNSRLGLQCNKQYSFGLIQSSREWILSAPNEIELKQWISICNELCQGKSVFSSYLILRDMKREHIWKKYFCVLYKNKVLNSYKNHNYYNHNNNNSASTKCVLDIDLKSIKWLKFCKKNEYNIQLKDYFGINIRNNDDNDLHPFFTQNQIKLNTKKTNNNKSTVYIPSTPKATKSNNYKQKRRLLSRNDTYSFEIITNLRKYVLTAQNQHIRNEWHSKIRNLFEFDTRFILKKCYSSSILNINVTHRGQQLKKRFCGLFVGLLIIFENQKQYDIIRRITFFNKSFINYIEINKFAAIELSSFTKIRRASIKNGLYAFCVTLKDKKWYFSVETQVILDEWLFYLIDSNKINNKMKLKRRSSLDGYKRNIKKQKKQKRIRKSTNLVSNVLSKSNRMKPNKIQHCDIEIESSVTSSWNFSPEPKPKLGPTHSTASYFADINNQFKQ